MEISHSRQKHTKAHLRDQIMKWREERQTRLAARVLHNRQAKVSSAIFGTVTSSDATRRPDINPPSSAAPVVKPGRNPKTRPNSAPEIKHTVASKLRMIKANPLLEARGLITLPSKVKKADHNYDKLLVGRNTGQLNTFPLSSTKKPSLQHRALFKPSSSLKNKVTSAHSVSDYRKGSRDNPRSISVGPPIWRLPANEASKAVSIRRIQSAADIQDLKDTVIKEENEEPDDDMSLPLPSTPKHYQFPWRARSELFSKSVERKKVLSPSLSVYTPTPDVMRKNLSDWLHKRGKSLGNFHHLQCFGLHASYMAHGTASSGQNSIPEAVNYRKSKQKDVQENHTSNSEPYVLTQRSEQEAFPKEEPACSSPAEENKENTCVGNSDLLVQDAVKDLLNIVNIGYPWDQCREWLTMIRKFCPGIKEEPIYWECVAALEEARGDFKSAVDCYERAIIRGASPTKVGESLDQLMEKFNMLNLNCDLGNDKSNSVKTPHKHVLDARNIFKSSIIKFALQQKVLRRLSTNVQMEVPSLHYVVTPVRRSTRPSLSRYRSAPGLHCVNSLKQLESSVRKSMVFQPNHALDS